MVNIDLNNLGSGTGTGASAIGGLVSNALGGGSNWISIISQATNFIREINTLLSNPAFSGIMKSRLNQGVSGGSGDSFAGSDVIGTYPIEPMQPKPQPTAPQEMDFEQVIKDMLTKPEGKQKFKDGLTMLMETVGDKKLSELIEMIDKPELFLQELAKPKQKPIEEKTTAEEPKKEKPKEKEDGSKS